MTREEREEVINILYGIRADNLDLDNAYTKSKYNALDMAIKALEQEPCEDAISRQAVLEQIDQWAIGNREYLPTNAMHYLTKRIQDIPPVNPTKTGHWIQTNEFFINQDGQFIYKFICSECKSLSYFRKSNKKAIGANVCPDCGAKMVEPQERSDKE